MRLVQGCAGMPNVGHTWEVRSFGRLVISLGLVVRAVINALGCTAVRASFLKREEVILIDAVLCLPCSSPVERVLYWQRQSWGKVEDQAIHTSCQYVGELLFLHSCAQQLLAILPWFGSIS